jgi:hypothetical protein
LNGFFHEIKLKRERKSRQEGSPLQTPWALKSLSRKASQKADGQFHGGTRIDRNRTGKAESRFPFRMSL